MYNSNKPLTLLILSKTARSFYLCYQVNTGNVYYVLKQKFQCMKLEYLKAF